MLRRMSAYRRIMEASLRETKSLEKAQSAHDVRLLRRLSDRSDHPNGYIVRFDSLDQFEEALGLSRWQYFYEIYTHAARKVSGNATEYLITVGDPTRQNRGSGEAYMIYSKAPTRDWQFEPGRRPSPRFRTIMISPPADLPGGAMTDWTVQLGAGGPISQLADMYGVSESDIASELEARGVQI